MLTGGCFCGAIRYQAGGAPFDQTNCHCSMCRRTTGAAFVTWFSVRATDFNFVNGEPTRFNSSDKATRFFCPVCGTQIAFQHADLSDEIDITTSSLDDPELVPPQDNVHTSSRLGWVVADGLPEYSGPRQGSTKTPP